MIEKLFEEVELIKNECRKANVQRRSQRHMEKYTLILGKPLTLSCSLWLNTQKKAVYTSGNEVIN